MHSVEKQKRTESVQKLQKNGKNDMKSNVMTQSKYSSANVN